MTQNEFLEQIRARNAPYRAEAYLFVVQAMGFAQSKKEERGHLSGQDFAREIAEFGREVYGPLVREVFEDWGLRETIDFGHIVYDLIDMGQMSKLPEDSVEDFREVYDFEEEFGLAFDWSSSFAKLSSPG